MNVWQGIIGNDAVRPFPSDSAVLRSKWTVSGHLFMRLGRRFKSHAVLSQLPLLSL